MQMWILFGILAVFGLAYVGIIGFPTEGFVVDIPNLVEPSVEQIGEPFTVLFWFTTAISSLYAINLIGRH